MNAVGVLILAIVVITVLSGSPSRALVGMVAGVLYLTQNQQLNLAGFNLYAFRFVELAGFVRVMARGEISFSRMHRVDKALLAFVIFTVMAYTLRTREEIAYRIGWGVDAFLCYFSFRGLIRSADEFRQFLGALVVLLIPYAIAVLYESYTKHNLFSIIGGRTGGADMMRGGRMRAAGTFRHASLMGTLGATFLPIYAGWALDHQTRKRAALGVIACCLIVWASNSGGPLSCAMVAVCGWGFWRIRTRMSLVRRAIALSLIALGLAMKAPIWYLIARVSSVTGGDGYHRSRLMEQGFNHLSEWWLCGMPIEQTQHWFAYYIHGTGGADITNQFLSYGIAAGIGSMGLFIYLLVQSFRLLGQAQEAVRSQSGQHTNEYLLWGLGVMLVVHLFNWIGITYFDQTFAVWYLQLAAAVACATDCLNQSNNNPTPAS